MNVDLESRLRLSQIIKRIRGSRSQRRFGKELGVSYAAIRSWEDLESLPGVENLEAIATEAGWSLEKLLSVVRGSDPMEEPQEPKAEDVLKLISRLSPGELQRLGQLMIQKIND